MNLHPVRFPLAAALVATLFAPLFALSACSADGGDKGNDTNASDAGHADGGQSDTTGGDAGGATPVTVETCTNTPQPKAAPGAAICAIEKGTDGILVVADVLLPGKVIAGGGVLLDAKGEITCVGCDCADKAGAATRIICPDAVVSPGLIDAHNHVGWLNSRPWVASEHKVDPALRWEHRHDWRKGKRGNPSVGVDGGGASTTQKIWGELRYVMTGTTAIFGSGDLSGLMRDLDSTGKSDNGLGKKGADYETFPLGDSSGKQRAEGCSYGSMSSPPATGHWVPHVAEGIDVEARNEFLCLTGQGAGSADLLSAKTSVIHGVGLRAIDYAMMATKGINLVWSPRSNVSLYGETARVVLAARLGVGIGLGADWVPSGSMNMLRELQCAAFLDKERYNGFFGSAKLWEMATVGAARALGLDDRVGVLAVGHVGDLAIFARRSRSGHDAVVGAAPGDVALVLRGGAVLSGYTSLVDTLETGCDAVGDVCGNATSVCTKRDTGKTFKEVEAEVAAKAYPLFFCGEPKDEPSCLPARSLSADSVEGSTVYAGTSDPADRDGDGIANEVDLCPDIFSPMRPLDAGKQADTDGDALGDSCDPCPLDADTSDCKVFNANDPDGDGIPSLEDNCPSIGNPDQGDKDADGKGDLCDACPEAKNAGNVGCPSTIMAIKTDKALEGARVSVPNVVVIASANDGYFVQDDAAVQAGTGHSGIFVYTGSETRPNRGDTIDITGANVAIYFGEYQLSSSAFVVTGKAEPSVHALTTAEAAAAVLAKGASPWEGALVRVSDTSVVNDKLVGGAGDPTAENEFELDTGLRLDDGMWEGDGFLVPAPNKGAFFASLTGALGFRFDQVKLLPRTQADAALGAPKVVGLGPATAWQREGSSGPALATPLTVTLSHAPKADITVVVVSDDSAVAAAVGVVNIAAGTTSATIDIDGKKAGKTVFRATIAGQKDEVSAEIVVLSAGAIPKVTALTPAKIALVPGAVLTVALLLEHPAPALGLEVTITVAGDVVVAPASVSVAGNALSATFSVKASAKTGTGKLTAASSAGATSADVTIVDPATLSFDLSGYSVAQTNGAKTFAIPSGSKIGAGTTLIIARNAKQADFETYWKGKLPAGTVYVDAADKFIVINGDETYTLTDAGGANVDGPTVAMKAGGGDAMQRKQPIGKPGDAASWTILDGAPGKSTPGTGCAIGGDGVFISEFSDASGTGAFAYEYVEICFSGPKP